MLIFTLILAGRLPGNFIALLPHEQLQGRWGAGGDDDGRSNAPVMNASALCALLGTTARPLWLAVFACGAAQGVRLRSLAGEPCRVRPGLTGDVKAAGARTFKLTPVGDGVLAIDLKKGEEVLLYAGATIPTAVVAAVPANPAQLYWYGLK